MNKSIRLVFVGFLLVVTGIFLVAISTMGDTGGFVYIFPFFFVSGNSTLPAAFIFLSALATIAYFYYISRSFIRDLETYEDIKCTHCGAKIESGMNYCPICATPVSRYGEDFEN